MENCSGTIGQMAGKTSLSMLELNRLADEKSKTDDAMDRLLQLHEEYTDQLF